MFRRIHTYSELKRQIHEDLRTQHPEWIKATGECPECDEHEARLKELLDTLTQTGSGQSFSLCAQTAHADRQIEPAATDESEA